MTHCIFHQPKKLYNNVPSLPLKRSLIKFILFTPDLSSAAIDDNDDDHNDDDDVMIMIIK